MARILVIDDDIDICNLLSRFLSKKGHEVDTAMSGKSGIAKLNEDPFDLVFCDFKLRDMDGRDVLENIHGKHPGTKIVIITGYSDIKIAVDVMKKGAFDYVMKPLIPDEILALIQRALTTGTVTTAEAATENKKQERVAGPKKQKAVNENDSDEFIRGNCARSKEVYRQIALVAPTSFSVIIYGESGSGKENIARTIHHLSSRKDKPFVAIDCGALTRELAGSELFGHEKGAFTGALAAKPGQFELAQGGTIFLDEVANLPYDIQVALLRLVQERKLRRVGGTSDMDIDVRIIVASNENLREAAANGKFREDLFHRFNEFSISLPALRERGDDIEAFARHFLHGAALELDKPVDDLEAEVLQLFGEYTWPGNLREMRNVIRRAVLLTDGNKVTLASLPPEIIHYRKLSFVEPEPERGTADSHVDPIATASTLKDAAAIAEAEMLKRILEEVKYNRTQAAKKLGIDRKTLFNKMKQYNL
jgi:two-component system response regulator HydG